MEKERTIPINQTLRDHYYTDEYIIKVNELAVKSYYDLIGADSNYMNSDGFDSFYKNEMGRIRKYLLPVLLKDSILYTRIDKRLTIEEDPYDQLDSAFRNFWENLNIIDAPMSEKSLLFKQLLDKYLVNKAIEITPRGIEVKWKRSFEKEHLSGLKIIESETVPIPLDSLSSGEKKILFLLFIAVFFENTTILIDEPELSLSIIWQQSLLPDILNLTNLKQIIIATHSPFIAEDESLHQYIMPLEYEDGDL